ncbi:MAG: hypothetical protein AAB899_01915, partial [Patescibacteria group bacterium]
MISDLVRVLVPAAMAFVIGILATPILTHYLYKYKAWKKQPGKIAFDGTQASEFYRLHEHNEVRAPRMGGIVVWGSVLLTILGIAVVAKFVPSAEILQLDFLSRSQTWLPLAALIIGSLAGLIDDLMVIRPNKGGMPLRLRLLIVIFLSSYAGW